MTPKEQADKEFAFMRLTLSEALGHAKHYCGPQSFVCGNLTFAQVALEARWKMRVEELTKQQEASQVYGYFDSASQVQPAHDPGLEIDCPYCKWQLSDPLVTISVTRANQPTRSYFYRAHKVCYESATPRQRHAFDELPLAIIPVDARLT